MRRILVLGGYGTFGGRIVRLLAAQQRWQIVVAGRSIARAEAFVAALGDPALSAAALDRDMADEMALRRHDPWLVIDASGPFQGDTAGFYPIVRAAIAIGAHYIDIADALDFVTGIGRFDAEAQARSLTVIAGASSVPTLSSAIVAALAPDFDEILEIEIAISSSNQASLGRSVNAALLSYAGKPIRVRRFGRWTSVTALGDWSAIDIEVAGREPLRSRLVAPCEVPDLALFPAQDPGLRKVMFRAGTELAILNRGSGLLARMVSAGLLRGLGRFTGLAGRAFGLLKRFGSKRSGMIVDLRGRRGGTFIARRWSVIAEQGDGLWIPAMAAALLTERLDRGEVPPGARPGFGVLGLDAFRTAFAGLAIAECVTEKQVAPSPFRRWLGDAVDPLPPAIRAMHDDPFERSASGTVTVTRGTHPLAVRMCRMLGFPESAPDRPLVVEFEPRGDEEIWRRCFESSTFTTRLKPWPGRSGHMRECAGPLAYGFELVTGPEGLTMQFRRWWFCGIPLPRSLGPRVEARQWQEGEDYCFLVDVSGPGIGRVIAYRGRLRLNRGVAPLLIRPAAAADAPRLSRLAQASYADAFGASMSAADLAAHLEATRSVSAFETALGSDRILVAEDAGALVGYVQFGAVESPAPAATPRDRELRGLYVAPGQQGQGIGRRLLAAALDDPALRAAENVYLDVWVRNDAARKLYASQGFVAVGERILELASGAAADPDIVMVRRQRPRS